MVGIKLRAVQRLKAPERGRIPPEAVGHVAVLSALVGREHTVEDKSTRYMWYSFNLDRGLAWIVLFVGNRAASCIPKQVRLAHCLVAAWAMGLGYM